MKPFFTIFLTFFMVWNLSAQAIKKSGNQAKGGQLPQTMIFTKVNEPNENAFSLLLPKGWQTKGGIMRVNPMTSGGSANAIDAKLDFAMMSDENATVAMRWLPELMFFDMRYSPIIAPMFPPGSNYNGMTVMPLMDANTFIAQVVFPYAHPGLPAPEILERKPASEIAKKIQYDDRFIPLQMQYDGGITTVRYVENGITYKEMILAVVQDFGQTGAGLWKNRSTIGFRAPEGEFEAWVPVFMTVIGSVQMNMQWVIGEIQGQVQRNQIQKETLDRLRELDNEILESQRKTNSQINHDMFLNLTGQEEYVNPYTKQTETGSNEWDYRWVNSNNEIIYTNDGSYNPNADQSVNQTEYQLSPIKKR
jgi:hypothetical protein